MPSLAAAGRTERLARLKEDRAVLGELFTSLQFHLDESHAVAMAIGTIEMELPSGKVERIEIRIEFGVGYPSRPPVAYDQAGRWPIDLDRHIVNRHAFCLYLRRVDEPDMHKPGAFEDYMFDLMLFLRQQLICDRIGRFPGPQWPHGLPAAYATHVTEMLDGDLGEAASAAWDAIRVGRLPRNDRCPCGSGLKLKHCHLESWSALLSLSVDAELLNFDYAELREIADAET